MSTWTWYYNYQENKKGVLKLTVLSHWIDDFKSVNFLVKIPGNPNKYKISQLGQTKNMKMEKVEGNLDIEYYKEFFKIQ